MIAPIEEFVKLLVIFIYVWDNINFNEENDGIVYTGTASIGFALFENILYVFRGEMSAGTMPGGISTSGKVVAMERLFEMVH